MAFQTRASLSTVKVKALFDGVSGSGKTMSALRFAFGLAGPDGKVGAICTQGGQINRYAHKFPELYTEILAGDFHPDRFLEKIAEAVAAKLDVLVIDSIYHEWHGRGGILEMVDTIGRRSGGSSNAWKDVTPLHRKFVDGIIQAPIHIISTCRVDTEWVYEKTQNRNGRETTRPRKAGLKTSQRAGIEYEYDLWLRIDADHHAMVEKSVFDAFETGVDIGIVTEGDGEKLWEWLQSITPAQAERVSEARQEAAAAVEDAPIRVHAEKQPVDASTAPKEPESTQEPEEDLDILSDEAGEYIIRGDKKVYARVCDARNPSTKALCGFRLWPGMVETYEGKEFKVSALIAQSAADFGRCLCPDHYLKMKAHVARQTKKAS